MNVEIAAYNAKQTELDKQICELIYNVICDALQNAENKIWHGHPVWFLNGNPIVGYSKQKNSVQLLFWSGQSFDEVSLKNTGKFKAAGAKFTHVNDINKADLERWLNKAETIQWDYKNIVKRKGILERIIISK